MSCITHIRVRATRVCQSDKKFVRFSDACASNAGLVLIQQKIPHWYAGGRRVEILHVARHFSCTPMGMQREIDKAPVARWTEASIVGR